MGVKKIILMMLIIGLVGAEYKKIPVAEQPIEYQNSYSYTLIKKRAITFKELLWCRRRLRIKRFLKVLLHIIIFLTIIGILLDNPKDGCIFLSIVPIMGVTIREADEKIRVIETEENITIEYLVPHKLEIKKDTKYYEEFVDIEMVRLCHTKDITGHKFLKQLQIGKAFNLSRQMTNRRYQVVIDGGFEPLIKNENEKSVLTAKVMERIAELLATNWHYTEKEIAEILIKEGLVKKISNRSIEIALSKMDVTMIKKLMKQQIEKGELKGHFKESYLIKELFKLVERLLKKSGKEEDATQYITLKNYQNNSELTKEKCGKYNRDVVPKRVCEERSRKRHKNVLERFIDGGWNLNKEREICCPDCMSMEVESKNTRDRYYKNGNQEKKATGALQFVCLNEDCQTNYFTILPNDLGYWSRANFRLKQQVFWLIFHVRGSLRRGADYLNNMNNGKLSWTTILNWIIKAGREVVRIEEIFPIKWTGYLAVDEKWVKRFGDWVYIYVAIDSKTGDTILQTVLEHTGCDSAKAFLYQIKEMGYLPKVITTDLSLDYDDAIKTLFPNAKHQKCVFHAEKDAYKLVYKYLPEMKNEELRNEVKKHLRNIFEAETKNLLEENLNNFRQMQNSYPVETKPIYNMLDRFQFHLYQRIEFKDIPQTNNSVENAIKEFDMKYQNTFGYSSIPALQAFLNAFTIYLRFKPYASGRYKGLCPLQIAGYDINNFSPVCRQADGMFIY